MRRFFVVVSSCALLLLTACSQLTNFVLVNDSGCPIEVRYKVKYRIDPRLMDLGLHMTPAVRGNSGWGQRIPWRDLSASQFEVDADSRTVTLTLPPGQALLLDTLNTRDWPNPAASFNIEELTVKGVSGEAKLQGELLYASFVILDYTLTYR